jgi:hypothetical protein
MRAIRLAWLAAFIVACGFAPVARATAFSSDQSDLWWNPAESGWGIQFVDRATIIFATMFVYGPSSAPAWYTATLNATSTTSWTGDLYVTSGPPFGNPVFDPAAVTIRKVGTMTWTAASLTAGTLTYSVDGVPVTKHLVRQFIAFEDYSGTFLGAFHQTISGCANPARNGTFEDFATVSVTQAGQSVGFTFAPQTGGVCAASGTLTQDGRFGTVTSGAACGGAPGSIVLSAMVVGPNSLVAHFESTDSGNGCKASGNFAGVRHR